MFFFLSVVFIAGFFFLILKVKINIKQTKISVTVSIIRLLFLRDAEHFLDFLPRTSRIEP